jgi:hypothetical protein
VPPSSLATGATAPVLLIRSTASTAIAVIAIGIRARDAVIRVERRFDL